MPAIDDWQTGLLKVMTIGLYFPASQLVHMEEPCVAEYVPAVQSVQMEPPATAEYLPAGQGVHALTYHEPYEKRYEVPMSDAPRLPYLPASHGEPEHVEAPVAACADEYVPATQFTQMEDPCVAEYVPAGQFVQLVKDGWGPARRVQVPTNPLLVELGLGVAW